MTTLTGSVDAARHQHRAEGHDRKLGQTAPEPQREATNGGLLKIAEKIHKTWLQEVLVFQIVPPLVVLHVATNARTPRSGCAHRVNPGGLKPN